MEVLRWWRWGRNFHPNEKILTEEIDIYKNVFFKELINLKQERINPKNNDFFVF